MSEKTEQQQVTIALAVLPAMGHRLRLVCC